MSSAQEYSHYHGRTDEVKKYRCASCGAKGLEKDEATVKGYLASISDPVTGQLVAGSFDNELSGADENQVICTDCAIAEMESEFPAGNCDN